MEILVWNEKLNIGVEVIDQAHANLFRIVGKLIEEVNYEANYKHTCIQGLKFLEDYTMKHFSEEEAYMRLIHYRGYEKHKQIHDTFRDQTLVSLKKALEGSDYSAAAVQHFLSTLLGWLTGHIMADDQEITGELHTAKAHYNPAETSAITQAVNRAMEDMFHLKASLINFNYTGRNLGMGFYFRLSYDLDDGGKVQVLLGVEERLIRRGVGMLFGISAMQDDQLVREASLQIIEQFLRHMGGLFDTNTSYHLSKQKLLTMDEFRSDFMTRYPYSMLFETRLGHFAFCARTWKVKKKKG